MTRAQYLRTAIVIGLRPREALRMAPGEIYDLVELYNRENAPRRKGEDFS